MKKWTIAKRNAARTTGPRQNQWKGARSSHAANQDRAARRAQGVAKGRQLIRWGAIGMGAILLDGVEIGAGSVVAAGALVTPGKKFPPGSMIMGAPAKAVRQVQPAERMEMIDQGWKNYHSYVQEYRSSFRTHA